MTSSSAAIGRPSSSISPSPAGATSLSAARRAWRRRSPPARRSAAITSSSPATVTSSSSSMSSSPGLVGSLTSVIRPSSGRGAAAAGRWRIFTLAGTPRREPQVGGDAVAGRPGLVGVVVAGGAAAYAARSDLAGEQAQVGLELGEVRALAGRSCRRPRCGVVRTSRGRPASTARSAASAHAPATLARRSRAARAGGAAAATPSSRARRRRSSTSRSTGPPPAPTATHVAVLGPPGLPRVTDRCELLFLVDVRVLLAGRLDLRRRRRRRRRVGDGDLLLGGAVALRVGLAVARRRDGDRRPSRASPASISTHAEMSFGGDLRPCRSATGRRAPGSRRRPAPGSAAVRPITAAAAAYCSS